MTLQKPLFIIGIIGVFSLLIVFAFVQSVWRASWNASDIPENEIVTDDNTEWLPFDPFVTPEWQVYRPVVRDTDPIKGVTNARVDIVEYGDFQCPYCAQVQTVLDEILSAYEGTVRLVWKDFPNPFHREAQSAARAARCAQEQGKFWEYHDYLFANQDQLERSVYSQIAQRLGLDMLRFDACVDSDVKSDLIGEGIDEAQAMSVDGTPHFLINGRRLPYAGTYEEFVMLIEQAMRERSE